MRRKRLVIDGETPVDILLRQVAARFRAQGLEWPPRARSRRPVEEVDSGAAEEAG